MKFNHWVKHNEVYYMPGEEVPIEEHNEPKAEKKTEKDVVNKSKKAK